MVIRKQNFLIKNINSYTRTFKIHLTIATMSEIRSACEIKNPFV